ncbi:hypothetical protein [Paraburkholderia terricola]|uniref:hypothetical protein n=1 Tax=Paraburkholderia terricola TaxID=169427 RepID=UPI001FD3141F|nr:hypothetical protein [Paraburkholderia terricola]
MMVLPATSTPRPLPRKRDAADKRPRLSFAGAVPAHASNDDVNSSGLAPAKAIQKKESESVTRLATIARIEALRLEIRKLAEVVALGADIELLDLMRDEVGSYSRHKAAQEARTWAEQARLSIETGLMQLDRAINPMS